MKRLRELRERAGLKQAQVARRLMLSPISVYRWETGIANPSVFHLKELAKIYNCTIDELLKEE